MDSEVEIAEPVTGRGFDLKGAIDDATFKMSPEVNQTIDSLLVEAVDSNFTEEMAEQFKTLVPDKAFRYDIWADQNPCAINWFGIRAMEGTRDLYWVFAHLQTNEGSSLHVYKSYEINGNNRKYFKKGTRRDFLPQMDELDAEGIAQVARSIVKQRKSVLIINRPATGEPYL